MNCKLLYIITLFFIANPLIANILQVDQITTKDGLPVNTVQSIQQDKFGFMWFASFGSICKYDGYKFKQYFPEVDEENTLFSIAVYNLAKDSANQLWVGFFDTTFFCRYNPVKDNFVRVPSNKVDKYIKNRILRSRDPIRSIRGIQNEKWTINNGKIIKSGPGTKQTYYCLNYTMNQPIDEDLITSLYIDKNNILWIGSDGQGLFKINTQPQPFYSYKTNNIDCNENIDKMIRSICDDRENQILWLGTKNNGLISLNRISGEIKKITRIPGDKNTICDNRIRSLYKDSKNTLWIGTKDGISMFNIKKGTFKNYFLYSKNRIPNPWVHAIMEDHEGYIWIGTFWGLARFNYQTNTFQGLNPKEQLKSTKVSGIIEDSGNRIWVSTQGGGVTCLKRTDKWDKFDTIHYLNIPNNKNSLSSNWIMSITKDQNDNIFVAGDQGINIIYPKTNKIKRIGVKDGLPDILIQGVLVDNNGYIWASHYKGLTKIEPETLEMKHYSWQDGLRSNGFLENSCYKNLVTGELFFGNDKGLVSFFPDSLINFHHVPKVYITGLQISNREVEADRSIDGDIILTNSIQFTDKITLKAKHKSFSIEFTGLQYVNPKLLRYSYTLEGFDNRWIETDAEHRKAIYSNLSAGNYIFKVRVATGTGMWSAHVAQLKIKVNPPWWKTWQAFSAYILILGSLLYFIVWMLLSRQKDKYRLKVEKIKAEKLEEVTRIRTNFYTNISHELRTPLTLIIDPINRMISSTENLNENHRLEIMKRNANRLLTLVNQLLDVRKAEEGRLELDLQFLNINELIGDVVNTFQLSANTINITIKFESAIETIVAQIDREKIETVLYNLLSNALKNSDSGTSINIKLALNNLKVPKSIELTIQNTGKTISDNELSKIFDPFYQASEGNTTEALGTGLGLTITKQIIELHGGEIIAESKEGVTIFKISIPFKEGGKLSKATEKVKNTKDSTPIDSDSLTKDIANEINEPEQDKFPHLLVIEDNSDIREYIRSELGDKFVILEAVDGQSGIEKVMTHIPDVIITDVMMPGMSGFEVCNELKNDMRTCHIPVIILTARQSEHDYIEGYETGADSYITKPFSIQVLETRIHSLLNSRKKLASYYSEKSIDEPKEGEPLGRDIFLEDLRNKILNSEEIYNVEILADSMNMSRSQLYRKVKTLTHQSASEFIAEVRMEYACQLLKEGRLNVSEIATKLGYSEQANFSRSFYRRFGLYPTQFIAKQNK